MERESVERERESVERERETVEWKRRNQDSGHFALTPALSRRRAGSVCRESSRGRGGTRGCRRWAVIGNEAWHGRALAGIVSLAPVEIVQLLMPCVPRG